MKNEDWQWPHEDYTEYLDEEAKVEIYVDPSVEEDGDGSLERPFKRLDKALEKGWSLPEGRWPMYLVKNSRWGIG